MERAAWVHVKTCAFLAVAILLGCARPPDASEQDTSAAAYSTTSFAFHEADAFDAVNATTLARLNSAAYAASDSFASTLEGIGVTMSTLKRFDDSASQTMAFYVEAGGAAFVVFRGTQNWQNAAEDADLQLEVEVVGQSARGFKTATDELLANGKLAAQIHARHVANPSMPLYVTGHSLGAAMATIFTARTLHANTTPIAALYTFGSPRTGDSTFAKGVAAILESHGTFHARVVDECDEVTNLPPRQIPADPAPPSNAIVFFEHVSSSDDENENVYWLRGGQLERTVSSLWCDAFPADIPDHDIGRYASRLGALAKSSP